jgi:hypothetical protein
MTRIQIYIDGLIADLPQNEVNLNLTFALKDRDGIAINSGSRSEYSFELPATKQNDLIFQRFFDIGEVTLPNQDLLPASIIVDGLPFFEGKAQMRSVTTQQDRFYWRGLVYKVSFYGNNIDWVSDLKNKYIYEYDFGNITFGTTQNYSDWGNTHFVGDNYCQFVMKFKDWAVFGQVDTFKESTPALFIKTIIDKIFIGLGYNLVSNFFNTDWFRQLIMPLPIDYDKPIPDELYGEEYLNYTGEEPSVNFNGNQFPYKLPNNIVVPTIGGNPYNNATGFYTVPEDGYYRIEIYIEITEPIFNYQLRGWISRNNNPAPAAAVPNTYFDTFFGLNGNLNIVKISSVVQAIAGETFSLWLASAIVSPTTLYKITMSVFGQVIIADPITIDFKYIINKELKALDFIKGLAHLFNLTFETDVALRTVTIEPADNYLYTYPLYNNIQQGFYNQGVNNITQKVDLSISGEIFNVDDFEQSIQLVYKDDSSDPTVEALNEGQTIPMAGAQFNFPVSRLKDGLNVIENPFFAPTLLFFDEEIVDVNSPAPIFVPFVWSTNYLENPLSSEANYEIVPRILFKDAFYNSYSNAPKVVIKNPFGASPATITASFPVAYMQDYVNQYNQSLVFNSETVNGVYVKGLMERFYLAELIRRLYGKQVQVNIFWDILMLNNLTFRDAVQIHGDNYILNEINSFSVVNQRSTQTYLTYDAKGDGTEVNNIQNTTVLTKYIP